MLATTPYPIVVDNKLQYNKVLLISRYAFLHPVPSLFQPVMDNHQVQQNNARDSPSQMPISHVKYHLPYFTPDEAERMSERQRGKLSMNQEEKQRQQACGFIESVGSKIGL